MTYHIEVKALEDMPHFPPHRWVQVTEGGDDPTTARKRFNHYSRAFSPLKFLVRMTQDGNSEEEKILLDNDVEVH